MADFQLQIIFDAFDEKRMRLRELQKDIKDRLEEAPGYKGINERLTAAKGELNTLMESVIDPGTTEELEKVKAEVKAEDERLQVEAITMALQGRTTELVVKRQDGTVLNGSLAVKFKT